MLLLYRIIFSVDQTYRASHEKNKYSLEIFEYVEEKKFFQNLPVPNQSNLFFLFQNELDLV